MKISPGKPSPVAHRDPVAVVNPSLLKGRQGLRLRFLRAVPSHHIERLGTAPKLTDRALAEASLNDCVGGHAFAHAVGGHHAPLEVLGAATKELQVLRVQLTPQRAGIRVKRRQLPPRVAPLDLLQQRQQLPPFLRAERVEI